MRSERTVEKIEQRTQAARDAVQAGYGRSPVAARLRKQYPPSFAGPRRGCAKPLPVSSTALP
jgi:hypothetical protein